MIYNLHKYLETEFLTENIYINNKIIRSGNSQVPDKIAILIEQPGDTTPWFHLTTQAIQILTRDNDAPSARAFSYDIYNKFLDEAEFGKILPAVTVDGILYPELQVDQISPIGPPQSLGMNEEKKAEFTTNYKIIYRRA
jgi:hypothetical protein